jgi:hypothetical protein
MIESDNRDELVNHVIHNLRALGQQFNDRLTLGNRRFSKRYLKSEIEVSVIFRKKGASILPISAPS